MKTAKPILHARDHMAGGADPIPGLLPTAAGDFASAVVGTGPYAYWRLGDVGEPWLDSSGTPPQTDLLQNGDGTPPTPNVTGALTVGDDGAVQFNYDGDLSTGGVALRSEHPGKDFDFTNEPISLAAWAKVSASSYTRRGTIIGSINWSIAGSALVGYALQTVYPTRTLRFTLGGATERYAETPEGAVADEWNLIVGTWDMTTIRLYINATLIAETTPVSGSYAAATPWISLGYGSDPTIAGTQHFSWFYGSVDEAIVWNRAITSTEIGELYAAATAPTEGGQAGDVLTLDDDGTTPVWEPPKIFVGGGGGSSGGGGPAAEPPDETPEDSEPADPGDPTDAHGWHLSAHEETVVLYDGSPGRFDVPSRRWVRVPFNTVRVWRSWEVEVDGGVKEAWLPDDRGLTGHAKDGVLHVTSEMLFGSDPMYLAGYFAIEYPVLDYEMLPDDDPEVEGGGIRPEEPLPGDLIAAPDDYMRAARMVNLSDGSVVRANPGGSLRHFFQWGFWHPGNDIPVSVDYPVDNPYPIYPPWPARPLALPGPYPKLSPTASHAYFDVGSMTGANLSVEVNPAGVTNYCLQAWQDSPWTIRFSTDALPGTPTTPAPGFPAYLLKPYLSFSFHYDPTTINHTTGKLKV